jgi:hypothetical protein
MSASAILEEYGEFANVLTEYGESASFSFVNALIATTISTNGIGEAIVALIIGLYVCAPVREILIKQEMIGE